jgi:hypothetical protein
MIYYNQRRKNMDDDKTDNELVNEIFESFLLGKDEHEISKEYNKDLYEVEAIIRYEIKRRYGK